MKTQFKLMTLSASLLACGLGMTTDARADAYAFTAMNVKDGFIAPIVNGVQDFSGTYVQPSQPGTTSATSATLTGSAGASNSIGGTNPDSPISALGSQSGRLNETLIGGAGGTYYTQSGLVGSNFSWGDARVVTEQTSPTTSITARVASEAYISSTGLATANSNNASSTIFNLPIQVGNDCSLGATCRLSFAFSADPYIYAVLTGGELNNPDSFARGTLTFSITLADALGDTVFSWAPNGRVTASGALGGTETADGENLNLSRQALVSGLPASVF